MNHTIFSYGTLAHAGVAGLTAKAQGFVPAILVGYRRNFRVPVESGGFSAAGIEKESGSECLGMLLEVTTEELEAFDSREYLYERTDLSGHELQYLSGEPLPEGRYYIYLPRDFRPPTEEHPLIQSYLDVMLMPFVGLEFSRVLKLISEMTDLDRPWVDDRKTPRYSRYPQGAVDTDLIDELLQQAVPAALAMRREAEDYRLKPGLIRSVMDTIRFFDLFDFPLTAEEIKEYLYCYQSPLHISELKATLRHLSDVGKLIELKGFYVFTGRESLIETRKARRFIAEKYWNRTKLYGQYLRLVPFTRMIAVCNNLAYDNPSESSDIDLFIVVRPGRMWTARFLITVILHFFGVRRHGLKIAGRFCLSFFVTSQKTELEEFELPGEDPYLAYWAKNLKPIFGREEYMDFRERNGDWLARYSLKFDDSYKKHMYHYEEGSVKKFTEWLFGGIIGDILEKLLQMTLKKKTLRSMKKLGVHANVIVTDEVLKFHNYDRRKEFLERWRQNAS